jgi:uncharacterized protein (DUF433 family)
MFSELKNDPVGIIEAFDNGRTPAELAMQYGTTTKAIRELLFRALCRERSNKHMRPNSDKQTCPHCGGAI